MDGDNIWFQQDGAKYHTANAMMRPQGYANNLQSTNAHKINITHAISQIHPHLCNRVIKKWNLTIYFEKLEAALKVGHE